MVSTSTDCKHMTAEEVWDSIDTSKIIDYESLFNEIVCIYQKRIREMTKEISMLRAERSQLQITSKAG
jgi:hypothetical protein